MERGQVGAAWGGGGDIGVKAVSQHVAWSLEMLVVHPTISYNGARAMLVGLWWWGNSGGAMGLWSINL